VVKFQNCPVCLKDFKVSGKQKRTYCSRDCLKIGFKTQLKGEANPNYRHGPKYCIDCGTEISKNAIARCNSCTGVWITGKNNPFYGKTHTSEAKEKISKISSNNKYWVGKKHKEESKLKLSLVQKTNWNSFTDEQKAERFAHLAKGTKTQLSNKRTNPELKTQAILEQNSIPNKPNEHMYNKFFVDFLLPEHNIVIEVFGDYWHANPLVFPTPSASQCKQIKKDKSRIAYLEKCGHKVLIVWEKDLKEDLQKVEKYILSEIFPQLPLPP